MMDESVVIGCINVSLSMPFEQFEGQGEDAIDVFTPSSGKKRARSNNYTVEENVAMIMDCECHI
jgi:hypothetical protein